MNMNALTTFTVFWAVMEQQMNECNDHDYLKITTSKVQNEKRLIDEAALNY
jgi:hypothetical protein